MQPGDLTRYLAEPTEIELELCWLFRADEPLTIFDVGCCEGEDSLRYRKRFRQSRVFAFEPLPINQQLARANFQQYAASGIELNSFALSDRSGISDFHVSAGEPPERHEGSAWNYGNKSSSLLAPGAVETIHPWLRFDQTIKVQCRRLDDFCRERAIEHIDFMHMDVQGAEALVLRGAGSFLKRITSIWLEVADEQMYAGQTLQKELARFMCRHGFAKALETSRGAEGDQFFVNIRRFRTWKYLLRRRISFPALRSFRRVSATFQS